VAGFFFNGDVFFLIFLTERAIMADGLDSSNRRPDI